MTKWMESQIETRSRYDSELLEHAYAELASSVTDWRSAPRFTVDDVEQLDGAAKSCLKYIGAEPGAVPDSVEDAEERIEWLCRPTGTMRRVVQLEKDWYKNAQKEDDVVISASPEFMIKSFCDKVGIKTAMASPVDMHTGVYSGENCHGEEKVRRYRAVFGDAPIHQFYSDSKSDAPLARLAENAYLVKGDTLEEWKP